MESRPGRCAWNLYVDDDAIHTVFTASSSMKWRPTFRVPK